MRWMLMLALAGCDPQYRIEGRVVEATRAPVAAVAVTMKCPSTTRQYETDASGRFDFGGVGGAFEADRCMLSLAKPGYRTRTIAPTAVCYRNTRNHDFGEPCTNRDVMLERDVTP